MFDPDQYELVDFGNGRKLERLAGMLIDRPSPPAEQTAKSDPGAWSEVAGRFALAQNRSGPERGRWTWINRHSPNDGSMSILHDTVRLELGFTPFGHIGVFPEQAANWIWLADTCQSNPRQRILNLFAYTGGSTLASAAAGAQVTHVDAAKSSVQWARRNAERSCLEDAPIRWIVDDALKFATREVKRHRQYDGIVLDPPSYGHGAGGEAWRLEQHLPKLIGLCDQLLAETGFLLLTCHTPDWDDERLRSLVQQRFAATRQLRFEGSPMEIEARDGRRLPSGYYLRCTF